MDRSREQKLVDVMFEISMKLYDGTLKFESREDLAACISHNLDGLGFPGKPMGMCWHVLHK